MSKAVIYFVCNALAVKINVSALFTRPVCSPSSCPSHVPEVPMRNWVLLVVLLLWLAMTTCVGCGLEFKNINAHSRSCQQLARLLDGGLKRRVEQVESREEVRRGKRQKKADARAAEKAARVAKEKQ